MSDNIRESPYQKGLYFVSPEPGTTLQSIGTTEWNVDDRYILNKVIGYGSNSCVCLATNTKTGEKVALKRIGDVLHSPDTAKRVLREVSILRRVSHPNIIAIKDCFVKPSATGQCRMINGKLVNVSLDVYIAMELADGGDLFHLRGQLSEQEVKSLTWQLLQALQYLHSLDIWHRDVKSQNAFINLENGLRIVKLGDFGSARSAIQRQRSIHISAQLAEQLGIGRANSLPLRPLSPENALYLAERAASMHETDSYLDVMHVEEQQQEQEKLDRNPNTRQKPTQTDNNNIDDDNCHSANQLGANPAANYSQYSNTNKPARIGQGQGFHAPLTRVVATPCYRAPEVVMSRGGYTAAIDTWSLGCIFGELLQRVAYVGSASTPHLAVAPLFAIKGMLKTPNGEESYGKPQYDSTTRQELQALFDVIGTPSWHEAASVPIPEWRRYLEKLPGKAPTLYRRFSAAGEPAVHLLSRLLEFDSDRRILCEEAMQHEYFGDLRAELEALAQQEGYALDERGQLVMLTTPSIAANDADMEVDTTGTRDTLTGSEKQQQQQQQVVRHIESSDMLHLKKLGSIVDVLPREVLTKAMQEILPHPTSSPHLADDDGGKIAEMESNEEKNAAFAAVSMEHMSLEQQQQQLATNNDTQDEDMIMLPSNNTTTTTTTQSDIACEHQPSPPQPSSPMKRKAVSFDTTNLQQQPNNSGASTPRIFTTAKDTSTTNKHSVFTAKRRYWEEPNPGKALALLEESLVACTSNAAQPYAPASEGYNALREMLERECEAIATVSQAVGGGGDVVFLDAAALMAAKSKETLSKRKPVPAARPSSSLSNMIRREGLVPDVGSVLSNTGKGDGRSVDASLWSDAGKARLSNVADTWQGNIDPSKYLGPDRHGEWTAVSGNQPASTYQVKAGGGGSGTSGGKQQAPAGAWGVSALPPGLDVSDPKVAEIIRKQQAR